MEEKKIAFKTLGCRLNQYETDAIASEFINNGFKVVEFDQSADVYIINTCTVTNQSDKKSRTSINSAIKKDAVVLVTGCMATQYKNQLQKNNQIAFVVDNKHKTSVFPIVKSYFDGKTDAADTFTVDVFHFKPAKDTFHTRSMIKIQDGCNNYCTFCIVPAVRGRAVSRPVNDIIENIKNVLEYGFKEIVLTGVNISRYEFEGLHFSGLIEKILNLDLDFRLRISSIEPDRFNDAFPELFSHPKLAPHLHLCLQSGSDKVLKEMKRFYRMKDFYTLVEKFRAKVPDFNFTTDIITGFPDETDEDFNLTMQAVENVGFSHVHTFKYSVRNGTKAQHMPNHINEKLKNERSEQVRLLAEKMKHAYWTKMLGKEQQVLVEKISESGIASGYGQHYIPVHFTHNKALVNTFYKVQLSEIANHQSEEVTGKLL